LPEPSRVPTGEINGQPRCLDIVVVEDLGPTGLNRFQALWSEEVGEASGELG